METLEYNFTI